MPTYLLRVQLDDRPGSLGALAVALGSVGADILSLDVVQRGAGYAIDDLVVDLPPGAMPDTLITAAENLAGVHVDSIRPHTGLLEAHRELELIDQVAAAHGRHERLQVLADWAPKVLRVSWCTVVGNGPTGPGSAGPGRDGSDGAHRSSAPRRIVGSAGAPETLATSAPWLPLHAATALDGTAEWVPHVWQSMDTTLAAAPLGEPHTAVLLGRPGGPAFRPSEVARLGYLAGIVATILG